MQYSAQPSPAVSGAIHEAPLHAGGEASAPATSDPRDLDLVLDPLRPLQQDLLCLVPVAL